MKFGFVAKHRGVWPVSWLCEALGVSRSGFHAWLSRPPSARAVADEALTARLRASFVASDRKVYRTRNQARADVFYYVERYYNPQRRHSTIGYLSPMEFERIAATS